MLQPRRISGLFLLTVCAIVYCVTGEENIESSPRKRRQDADDVTTVLLVDNQGRSTFGRFLSVKPDLGLLTSTARTFIQEGVTTQYATQVLGTTLDNGRLYAHLLTKSSRVLYDSDLPTRSYNELNSKKWNLDNNLVNSKNFVKNTDYISPNKAEPYLVFPTAKPTNYHFVEKESNVQKDATREEESGEDEILKSAPSNNARIPYEDAVVESVSQSFNTWTNKNGQSNIKVFQITPKHHDMNLENVINYKDLSEDSTASSRKKIRENDNADVAGLEPSKVRERDSLPTFTVRNEFSPSGLSYLGDFAEFDINTERSSRPTTAAEKERKAKLFFRPGKQSTQDLKKLPTVTYSGFADFTTVVGDTVIVFAPYTSESPRYTYNRATSILGEPTIKQTSTASASSVRPQFGPRASPSIKLPIPTIRPSGSIKLPIPSLRPTTTGEASETEAPSTTTTARPPPPPVRPTIRLPNLGIRPSFTIRRPKPTKSYTSQEFDIDNDSMRTVIIDATDRHRESSTEQLEEGEDMDAKSAVLAHEQKISLFDQSPTPQIDSPVVSTSEDISTVVFSPDVIEPSESQTPMLSTPSEEDIAKIFASLQAAQNKQATEPLETSSTTVETSSSPSKTVRTTSTARKHKPSASGATTIFFDDDYEIKNTAVLEQPTTSKIEEPPTTTTEFDTTVLEEDEEEEEDETTERKESTKTTTARQPTTIKKEETTTPAEQTTTPKEQTTTQKLQTTTRREQTTTQKQQTTTQKEPEATNEILTSDNTISTLGIQETTPQIDSNEVDTEKSNDEDETKTDVVCTEGSQVIPTTVYKTLTYLTTFFIPVDETTTTSVKSNEIISTEIGFQTRACAVGGIIPTAVTDPITPAATTTPEPTTAKITTQKAEEETTRALEGQKDLEPTTEHISTFDTTTWTIPYETTPLEITTERRHVTESEPETTEMTTENGEEIEVLFKTLYTTYTYLTTYFQESTSSIASRKEVITNVITSTLEPGSEATDAAVAGLFAREDSLVSGYKSKPPTFDDITEIAPTKVATTKATVSYPLSEEDIRENILDHDLAKATPILNDEKLLQTANGIKTYYTTYTYFTTIFVDGETEISSRTEVYTNYVTPSIQPSVSLENLIPTALPELIVTSNGGKDQVESPDAADEEGEEDEGEDGGDEEEEDEEEDVTTSRFVNLNVTPLQAYNTTINRHRPAATENTTLQATSRYGVGKEKLDNNIVATTAKNSGLSYSTLNRGGGSSSESSAAVDGNVLNLSDYETISTMVTDVRSSTSTGESRIIDNVDKRNVLDDQIVAETNNDSEIIPSPTLLLQTSYTTFTYFTTMYQGTTSSNVVSRLETVTNVVTETLTPTHTLSAEDLNLPITYFTTFTYWTTLYKEGVTKVTSREETVSNIVTPSAVATTAPPVINITPIVPTSTAAIVVTSTDSQSKIEPTKALDKDELTTYYTTYTYYTTSYLGNSTVLNSRLETVTNVVNETAAVDANQIARAIGTAGQNQLESPDTKSASPSSPALLPTGLLSTIVSTIDNSGTKTILSTDIYGTFIDGLYAKVLESATSVITDTLTPTTVKEPVLPTGVVSLNEGKIVDAEGISTLYYTTKAVGTFIDNLYAQVIESTSSLKVDEERKSALVTDESVTHKTGLVRLIEGSIVQNRTTTLYQSKVIGTVIEGRYAQIIESTSSFIIEKTQAPSISPSLASGIAPTATQGPDQQISGTAAPISPSPVVLEGSLSDSTKTEEENSTESDEDLEGEEEQDDDKPDENGRKKSRLTYKSRKQTFTPAIRPFASRGRPTFAPKRKGLGPSGATTITRSDITPTVTAVPAFKSGSRFGNRKSSSSPGGGAVHPTASGSRRFVRPKSSSTAASGGIPSSSFVPRGRSSSRITPTASGSRKSSGKTSGQIRSSSAYTGNTRFARIRPTAVSSLPRALNSKGATPSTNEVNDDENDLTTQITENPTDFTDDDRDTTIPLATTTEGARRNQNPLLKLRRPPLARPAPSPRTPTAKNGNRNVKKGTGNKATTTTAKPRSTRPLPALVNRPRPGNGLFPRRGLFTTTTTPSPDGDEDEEEDFEGEDEDDDTDYDGSNTDTQTEKAPTSAPSTRKGRANAVVSVRPFKFRQRSKRETNYSRFRRPGGRSTAAPKEEEPETEAPRSGKQGRFKPRPRGGSSASSTTQKSAPAKRLSPTRASSNQGRSQFTLREKDKSSSNSNSRSNFRRSGSQPTKPSSGSRRSTTVSSRLKAPKLRAQHTTEGSSRRKSGTSAEASSRSSINRNTRRGSSPSYSRSKVSAEQIDNFVLPNFNDGTITITHSIPTEVTIPVVNGKVTEYRNVITAKYSTEVLVPKQYSTAVNSAGKVFTVLRTDSTNVVANGNTEVTRFILNETPTTTVIFTPTYIRGHKTSWSHVLPSTVYGVDQVVNTVKPKLAAQAPLANILLSQLLLGNGGIQPNPLLGLQNPGGAPATPTTEFKTRTTTYVTTVTSATSTVIPITFRGKEIFTTIIDSSVSVVTATEFVTDTVVVTPTLGLGGAGLNSLLLPLLLQQQQQPAQAQQPGALFEQPLQQGLFQESAGDKYDFLNFDDSGSVSESEEFTEQNLSEDVTRPPRRKGSRKKPKAPKNITPAAPPKETSIVTLYVSGKTPGEFSTILSTVVVGEENQRRKRDVFVAPSRIINQEASTYSYIDTYVAPALNEDDLENVASSIETQSLESVLGDVSKHVVTHIPELFDIKPTKSNKPKKYTAKYIKENGEPESHKESSRNFLA